MTVVIFAFHIVRAVLVVMIMIVVMTIPMRVIVVGVVVIMIVVMVSRSTTAADETDGGGGKEGGEQVGGFQGFHGWLVQGWSGRRNVVFPGEGQGISGENRWLQMEAEALRSIDLKAARRQKA